MSREQIVTFKIPRSYLLLLRGSIKTLESDKRRAHRSSIRKGQEPRRIEMNRNAVERSATLLNMIDSQLGAEIKAERDLGDAKRRERKEVE